MQRISNMFEERFVAALCSMLTLTEQAEIDYELAPTAYPSQQPDGSAGVSMGISVSLATRALTLGDHVMVSVPDHDSMRVVHRDSCPRTAIAR